MSNQACERALPNTVSGLGEPVGKISLLWGRWAGSVAAGVWADDGRENGMERIDDAKEAPVCDVPWRNIIVEVWVAVGWMMKGSGCMVDGIGGCDDGG